MTQGRQSALEAPASVVGDYQAMLEAGVNPNSFLPEGYAEYKKGTKFTNLESGLSPFKFRRLTRT